MLRFFGIIENIALKIAEKALATLGAFSTILQALFSIIPKKRNIKEDQRAKTSASAVTGELGLCSYQAVRTPENHWFLRYQAIKLCTDDVTGADSSQFYKGKV